jgi:ribosomal protein S27AE
MAEGKKAKSKNKHRDVQRWKLYKDGKFAGKWCPREGQGFVLAQHKGRTVCGHCGYAEISKGEAAAKKQQ